MPRLLAFLLLCAALWAPAAALAETKVGFINVMRLVEESEVGRLARDDIAALRAQKEKSIQESMRDIEALEKKVNETFDMDTAARKRLTDELQAKYRYHQKLVTSANEMIQREDVQLYNLVMEHADKALRKVARDLGYTLIVKDLEAVGYVDPAVDITDKVLQELNR
jgi:outer membrane protein